MVQRLVLSATNVGGLRGGLSPYFRSETADEDLSLSVFFVFSFKINQGKEINLEKIQPCMMPTSPEYTAWN